MKKYIIIKGKVQGVGFRYWLCQTAIISHLCEKIYTIEIFKKLFDQAKLNIEKLQITNVTYELGNVQNICGEKNFFDAIIVSAGTEEVPSQLLKNLKINGKLIFPKKYSFENQKLILIKKITENNFEKEELFDVKFVPLLNENIKH